MKKTKHLGLLVVVSVASGCANVMYLQRFRPVDLEIRAPAARPSTVLVWVPEPTAAASIASKLERGLFSASELGAPAEYDVSGDVPIVAVAEGYGVRSCGLRVFGLPRPQNPISRPLLLVAVKLADAATYHVFVVSNGRSIQSYEVDASAALEILEVISGHPTSGVKRGRDRDQLTLYVSELVGSTPNHALDLSVRPVTPVARGATGAPVPPAGQHER